MLRTLLVIAALLQAACAGASGLASDSPASAGDAPTPCVPTLDEANWVSIAGQPDLGELGSDRQQPVDFAVWQAADGTWQLWSCIRRTKESGHERLLFRWEGESLGSSDWTPKGIAMRGDPELGEAPGGVQAPYVIRRESDFLMYYGDWDSICLARSEDGKEFERCDISDGFPQLFSEGRGNNARDPMLIKIGSAWNCYYSAMRADSGPRSHGGIFVRSSTDLFDWSDSTPKKVLAGGSPGNRWWHLECPHVVFHQGYYYLFRTSNYEHNPVTTVYRSLDPESFGIDDDSKIVATLPIAAPEVIHHEGRLWVAALKPRLDGVRLTKLDFIAE